MPAVLSKHAVLMKHSNSVPRANGQIATTLTGKSGSASWVCGKLYSLLQTQDGLNTIKNNTKDQMSWLSSMDPRWANLTGRLEEIITSVVSDKGRLRSILAQELLKPDYLPDDFEFVVVEPKPADDADDDDADDDDADGESPDKKSPGSKRSRNAEGAAGESHSKKSPSSKKKKKKTAAAKQAAADSPGAGSPGAGSPGADVPPINPDLGAAGEQSSPEQKKCRQAQGRLLRALQERLEGSTLEKGVRYYLESCENGTLLRCTRCVDVKDVALDPCIVIMKAEKKSLDSNSLTSQAAFDEMSLEEMYIELGWGYLLLGLKLPTWIWQFIRNENHWGDNADDDANQARDQLLSMLDTKKGHKRQRQGATRPPGDTIFSQTVMARMADSFTQIGTGQAGNITKVRIGVEDKRQMNQVATALVVKLSAEASRVTDHRRRKRITAGDVEFLNQR